MKNKRNAFTLIELLVVVSIIALLVSILLPALSKAREQAKTTICTVNLKSIYTAMVMYSHEHNGWIVPAVSNNNSSNSKSWDQTLIATRCLDNNEVYHCPSHKSESESPRSYTINAWITSAFWDDNNGAKANYARLESLEDSYSMGLLLEAWGSDAQSLGNQVVGDRYENTCWTLWPWNVATQANHSGRQESNVLFVDGQIQRYSQGYGPSQFPSIHGWRWYPGSD